MIQFLFCKFSFDIAVHIFFLLNRLFYVVVEMNCVFLQESFNLQVLLWVSQNNRSRCRRDESDLYLQSIDLSIGCVCMFKLRKCACCIIERLTNRTRCGGNSEKTTTNVNYFLNQFVGVSVDGF